MSETLTSRNVGIDATSLEQLDPAIANAIQRELERQQSHIELIASENFTLPAVMQAQGSILTNKYAEGYPGKRWYGGCAYVDEVEKLAINRAKALFGAEYANVQPHSGSQANAAVYFAMLEPGDKILTMNLAHGGHLTHGHPNNFSGQLYQVVNYGVDPQNERINYDEIAAMAEQEKPKLITIGASAYSRIIDFETMGRIAKSVGALLLADIAHIAGLVAAGLHPSPVPHADFVTTTTHKTLRGPRGGLILAREEYGKAIDSSVFPGAQGGPLMHVIAGKAVCFQEAAKESFKTYAAQVIRNAQALAKGLDSRGHRIVSGGTENHVLMVDLRQKNPNLTGKAAQEALDLANITCNKNTIPFETRSPFQASGIRLGSPAVTSRGFTEEAMDKIAEAIDLVLAAPKDEQAIAKAKEIAVRLSQEFPLPY